MENNFFRRFLDSILLTGTKPLGSPGRRMGGWMGRKLLNPEEIEFYRMYLEKWKKDNMSKDYLTELEGSAGEPPKREVDCTCRNYPMDSKIYCPIHNPEGRSPIEGQIFKEEPRLKFTQGPYSLPKEFDMTHIKNLKEPKESPDLERIIDIALGGPKETVESLYERVERESEDNIVNIIKTLKKERDMLKDEELENKLMEESSKQVAEEQEIWKDIKGYEEYYEISNLGKVRRKSYIMSCRLTKDGYPAITLCGGGTQKSKTIHRLVAEHFIENLENKPTVNHKFGDKKDNRASMLEWNTQSENVLHALELGLRDKNWQDGELNPQNILTKEQVLDIREKCKTMKISEVHKQFYPFVHYNTIYAIKIRRIWKNI